MYYSVPGAFYNPMRLSLSAVDLVLIPAFLGVVTASGVLKGRLGSVMGWLATIACAAYAVWIDSHNDEVQAAVLVILVGTFALGLVLPTSAWRSALIIGLAIPLRGAIRKSMGMPHAVSWDGLVALIPGCIGAYSGVLFRRLYNWA